MFLIKILVSCFVNVWINRINKNIIVKIFVLIFFYERILLFIMFGEIMLYWNKRWKVLYLSKILSESRFYYFE